MPTQRPGTAHAGGHERDADRAGVPEAVRVRLAELAAAALADMPGRDIPASLRPVAKFAPAKRARLGGGALVDALQSTSFRAAVVRWCRDYRPEALEVAAPDPVCATCAAWLTGANVLPHYLELMTRRAEHATLRAEREAADARSRKLAAENERLRGRLSGPQGTVTGEMERLRAEADRFRRKLREQGVKLRAAREEAESARVAARHARSDVEVELKALADERDRQRDRAASGEARANRAEVELENARNAAREARAADEVRLGLLLQTLDGAVGGVRRELGLDAGVVNRGARPAETVSCAEDRRGMGSVTRDAAALEKLCALPGVHMIVDGYNVTKTAHPDMALSDQRDWLVRALAVLSARTSIEVTVVFDGAGVVAVPVAAPRGVRVLFSAPGVLADDVIRSLVAAEPDGRPLLVVTSDREIVDSVRARGAHSAPSAVLVEALGGC